MDNKKRYYNLAVLISLFSIIGIFIAFIFSIYFSMQKYSIQLENSYKKNLYQLVENVDNLQVDMSKIIATNSSETQRDILIDVRTICTVAVNNLSLLPIEREKVSKVNNFFNMVSGYSQSLIDKINNKEKIKDLEFSNFEKLFNICTILLEDVNGYISTKSFDYTILNEINFSDELNSEFSAGIASGDNPESELPTLIFDGPFSESVVAKKINGLPGDKITKEKAVEIVKNLNVYYKDFVLEYVGETLGDIETFNFKLKGKTINLFVQIAKRGGLLLNITSYGAGGNDFINNDVAKELCLKVSKEFGFKNLEVVWGMEDGNILYFNLAPKIKDVVYYPDLIKVKIDRDAGVIIGWDAVNYAYNHIGERIFQSSYNILDGKSKLNSILKVKSMSKTIIPNKYSGESCAFEYICEWKDYTYYIYLDSKSGKELKIMRLVSTSSGNLLV